MMTRQVIYITDPASSAQSNCRFARNITLMLDMQQRGILCGVMDSAIQVDYAPQAPDVFPAGACEQNETYLDKNDEGIEEYAVSACQMTVYRD